MKDLNYKVDGNYLKTYLVDINTMVYTLKYISLLGSTVVSPFFHVHKQKKKEADIMVNIVKP